MSNPGLDAGRAIPMNRFAFGCPIQPTLQFGKEFGGFRFFTGTDQSQELFLRPPSRVQKTTIHLPTTQGGAGLFGGGCSVGHKVKQCPKEGVDVNP
jgi:hypothetical protein